MLTRAELRELGFTKAAISHSVRTGRLWPRYRDVFAVGHPGLTARGECLAAASACGHGAALGDGSAGVLHRLLEDDPPRRHHVVVPTAAGRRAPPGIRLHRAPTLRADDVTVFDAIPITTIPRTLLDLAGSLTAQQLTAALRQAERVHRYDLADLRAYLADRPVQATNAARLRRVLAAHVPAGATQTEREAAFLEICARHGIPLPRPQYPIGSYRADFAWPDLELVVEIDDRESHDGYVAFGNDRIRDRAMVAAGFVVLRFTVAEVLRESAAVAREVAAAIDRRLRTLRVLDGA